MTGGKTKTRIKEEKARNDVFANRRIQFRPKSSGVVEDEEFSLDVLLDEQTEDNATLLRSRKFKPRSCVEIV